MINIAEGSKIFSTSTVKTYALRNVNLSVNEGEFLAILGKSGSGKTTLLNVIGMLEVLDEGKFCLGGEDISELSVSQRFALRRSTVSFVFQSFNLISHYSVTENIALPLKFRGIDRRKRTEMSLSILEQLDLVHRKNHYPAQLSGGEQQRVAIARATVTQPKVILADEPTGNLDNKTGELVLQQFTDLNAAGTTVLMVTHSEVAARVAHRRIIMSDGYIE